MPVNTGVARFGLAKQSIKGTAIANPAFAMGMRGGEPFDVNIDSSVEERTTGTNFRMPVGSYRKGSFTAHKFRTRCYAGSTGLFLYGALGAISTSGAGPYTHTITPGAVPPWLTTWSELDNGGSAAIYKSTDTMIDELTLSWSGNEPPEFDVSMLGITPTFTGNTFVPTTNETNNLPGAGQYIAPGGGTFKYDIDSATAVAASIESGSVKIANTLTPLMLPGTLAPSDMLVEAQAITWSLEVLIANLDDWRALITGSAGGTTVSTADIFGSAEVKFVDGSNNFTLGGTRIGWKATPLSVDPGNKAARMRFDGQEFLSSVGANTFTATVINTTTSY